MQLYLRGILNKFANQVKNDKLIIIIMVYLVYISFGFDDYHFCLFYCFTKITFCLLNKQNACDSNNDYNYQLNAPAKICVDSGC